ncbi:outer membrane protein [Desulfocapsa sulfexigens DSM 10523]|uniref:Outer membrane protein n=1 Tax=Desulfocapsa sulfexigens (strain DSM 10523 / SB164P1) TaxID=1167006 RepID=M1NKD3_DESSD|nr:outer membrane protein [Desulfocapsa sulfexigens DSM 10523]
MIVTFCAILGLSPKIRSNISTLVLCLSTLWLTGLLLPTPAHTTSIRLHEIKTTDSFTTSSLSLPRTITTKETEDQATTEFFSPGSTRSEPDILKVYKALFKQTWEQSPDIQVARKMKQQKAAEQYTAWANRISPQLDFEIAQKRFLNKDLADDTIQTSLEEEVPYTDGKDITDWNFDLDIPLYRRPLSLAIDVSRIEYELAANNLEIKTRELDARLHELLGNYMVASYNLHNLENSIFISGEHVNKIQRGYDLRDQTKLALLRAQANLKELEARRDLNGQRRDTTFRELLDFTAIPENDPTWHWLKELLNSEQRTAGCINSFSALQTGTEKMQPFLTEALTEAELRDFFVNNSLLYKKILLERNLGKIKAKKYTQQEWPALFVRGEFDRKADTQFNDYNGEGSIGLVLSVPLFSGGTIFSNIKTETMASDITSIEEHSTILRTFNSIANKKKTISSLRDIYEKQQIHLQQQQEIVRLSLKSYQIKQTSMQDLLTSKNRLIDAKNLLMQTTTDLGVLLRQFAWELGTPFPAP